MKIAYNVEHLPERKRIGGKESEEVSALKSFLADGQQKNMVIEYDDAKEAKKRMTAFGTSEAPTSCREFSICTAPKRPCASSRSRSPRPRGGKEGRRCTSKNAPSVVRTSTPESCATAGRQKKRPPPLPRERPHANGHKPSLSACRLEVKGWR